MHEQQTPGVGAGLVGDEGMTDRREPPDTGGWAMTRDGLIAALEAATGPSFVLDGAIDGWRIQEEMAAHGRSSMHLAPRPYTASLDAAMTLVPDGVSVMVFRNAKTAGIAMVGNYSGEAASPAIALCIAALKAYAEAGR